MLLCYAYHGGEYAAWLVFTSILFLPAPSIHLPDSASKTHLLPFSANI